MSELQTLMDMGFSQEKASRALEVTNNKGVEPAMEWLLAHIDDAIVTSPAGVGASTSSDAIHAAGAAASPSASVDSGTETLVLKPDASEEVAKSIKCNDCQRLFKTQMEVEFHAAKTGHSDFAESTEEKRPLTEEEKKEQLAKLEEKLKKKRVEREEQDKMDALERERVRIKSGKDMSEARRKMEEMEMKKIVDQRKREKEDEKLARNRVKAQIEADKAARKARLIPELGQVAPEPQAEPAHRPVPQLVPQTDQSATKYSKTKIQVRMQNGSALTQTFDVKEQLSAVRLFVQLNQDTTDTPFSMMTSFPRKVFSAEDYDKPLEVLGLVPTAVIIVTKAT